MSCDENSFKHNKQTSSKRKQPLSCIKVRFSSPESIMGNLPFSCGWGWHVSLSLEKEFEDAAGAILRWISFELWNSLDCTMGSCGDFSFNYRWMALCTSLRHSSPLVSVSFWDLSVELYIQDLFKFFRRRLFQNIFFKMAGSGLAPASEDVHSFTVLLSGSKDYICLFTATELRSCTASFETTGTWKHVPSWDDYEFVAVFRLFMLYWTRYHTDLEQMLKKKRQNIRQNGHWMLETSCKVGLQP